MTILTPRVRTIGVRLCEEEYSQLERFCAETGAHSMADVARSAISVYIQDVNRKQASATNAKRSSIEMRDLQKQVAQLTSEIAQLRDATALFNADVEGLQQLKRTGGAAKGQPVPEDNA